MRFPLFLGGREYRTSLFEDRCLPSSPVVALYYVTCCADVDVNKPCKKQLAKKEVLRCGPESRSVCAASGRWILSQDSLDLMNVCIWKLVTEKETRSGELHTSRSSVDIIYTKIRLIRADYLRRYTQQSNVCIREGQIKGIRDTYKTKKTEQYTFVEQHFSKRKQGILEMSTKKSGKNKWA